MSDPAQQQEEDVPRQGPGLTLLFGLLALAFAVAIAFAWLILRPFHLSR